MKYALQALFLFILMGCEKKIETKPRIIVNKSMAADFKIPDKIFTEIKNNLGENFKVEPEFLFTELEVELFTDQKSVLSYSNLVFKLPKGGGAIDLKDYVTGEGSFYLSFPKEQFLDKPSLEFLFYISDSPKVKIRNEFYGLGCGQWVDLKPRFTNLQDKTFLKVNTVDQTYVHVLTGQYIFVFKKGIQYYLTHLNLKDSRYQQKTCSYHFSIDQ